MTRYAIGNDPYQENIFNIRGQDMRVIFYLIEMNDAWYADIYTPEGAAVALGECMVSGVDTGFKFGVPGVYIAGPNGEAVDPGVDGWDNIYLYVLEEDELDAGFQFTLVEPTYLMDGFSDPLSDGAGLLLVVE